MVWGQKVTVSRQAQDQTEPQPKQAAHRPISQPVMGRGMVAKKPRLWAVDYGKKS